MLYAHRDGRGTEEFGNRACIAFVCPMGHNHPGKGYCIYKGTFERDLFHGTGEFSCADGRCYKGNFKNHMRHGEVKGHWY